MELLTSFFGKILRTNVKLCSKLMFLYQGFLVAQSFKQPHEIVIYLHL